MSRLNTVTGVHANLDLVITNSGFSDKIVTKALEETLGSDHFPISINIYVEKYIYKKKFSKITSIRSDTDNICIDSEKTYYEFLTPQYASLSPIDKYNFFINNLTKVIKNHTPRKRQVPPLQHRNPMRWWDADCDRAKRVRRAAFKKCSFTGEMNDLIAYEKTVAEATKLFKKKKRKTFREFAESIDGRKDMSHMWNNVRILKNRWVNISGDNVKTNLQVNDKIEKAKRKICPDF